MNYQLIFISLLLITSCKSEKESKIPKKHNPYENIEQNLENEKAIELYHQGLVFYENGNLESAMESFNKSFKIEKSAIILNELGTIELAKKDYQEALNYFNRGRTLDSNYWPIYINEARCHDKLTEFKKAENILLKLKELSNSEYWITYANYDLAKIYFNSKQGCEKVYEFIEKAKSMASDPELSEQYLNFKSHVTKNCGQ